MLLTNVPGSTQWAAVRTRFSLVLSTTLAVQKCVTPPLVVKNRAPTVGTPLKSVAEGVPGGGLIAGPAVKGTGAGVAAAIREGVQSARAVCCADAVTVCTTPISGCEPAVDAAAITAAAGAAATTASTNTVLTVQRRYRLPQRPMYALPQCHSTYWHNMRALGCRIGAWRRYRGQQPPRNPRADPMPMAPPATGDGGDGSPEGHAATAEPASTGSGGAVLAGPHPVIARAVLARAQARHL